MRDLLSFTDQFTRAKNVASVESIATQFDQTGVTMEGFFQNIKTRMDIGELLGDDFSKDPTVKELEKYVFERFGLKVQLITNELNAAMEVFYANKNHIFLPDFFRGNFTIREQQRLIDSFNDRKGFVDSRAVKVGGIYSEYTHSFYLNLRVLFETYKLTPAQVTGIAFHEIGHAFDACLFADRMSETNQVLASIARTVADDRHGKQEHIFKDLEKITDKDAKEVADRICNGNRIIAGATLFKVLIKHVTNQLRNGKYNQTSFEERSDNFASRFGYGKELIISLDKIYEGSMEKSNAALIFAHFTVISVTIVLAGILFSALVGTSFLLAFYAIFINAFWWAAAREDVKDYTYDNLKTRYVRIRQDLIDQLKDIYKSPQGKKHAAAIKEQIDQADIIIRQTKEYKHIPSFIVNLLFKDAREAVSSIDDQKLMEHLASNDLFLEATAVKHGL